MNGEEKTKRIDIYWTYIKRKRIIEKFQKED